MNDLSKIIRVFTCASKELAILDSYIESVATMSTVVLELKRNLILFSYWLYDNWIFSIHLII